MNTISPNRLNQRHTRGERVRLLDVRTPAEYRTAHVPFAENCPLESLDAEAVLRTLASPEEAIYVICEKGGRGGTACAQLSAAGLRNVVNVEGGTAAWEAAGLPVVRGKRTISLERQVRIAAGLLVLAGLALGYFVHPWFVVVSAFVGAGLTFAGITDTCGMGMLLARMPWNQVRTDSYKVACCERS